MLGNPVGSLADFLKARRTRLDPAAFGFSGRRRTPGLRREEVAQRANISPTWYTWLEQGRGGAPSAEVLERIASALMLTSAEREHIFMLGLGRPPEVRYSRVDGVSPRLQRLLDSFEANPAIIKTATWEVLAWNRAAAVVLTDYDALPPGQRNILRFLFCNPAVRATQHNWDGLARFAVGAFRADVARAGMLSEVGELVRELSSISAEFDALWRSNEVPTLKDHDAVKRLDHPKLGPIELEYSGFAVDGRPELNMIVYTAVDTNIARRIKALAHDAALAPQGAIEDVSQGALEDVH